MQIITKTFRSFSVPRLKTLFISLAVAALTGLQAQTTYSFTTAGATGRFGPTQAQLNTAYASTNLNGNVVSASGIQSWTVPVSGDYSITVAGATGGSQGATNFGTGASMSGRFTLTAGEVLQIVVGQKGVDSPGSVWEGCGGGGGSFVVKAAGTVPLIIGAGGAGGDGNGNYSTRPKQGGSSVTGNPATQGLANTPLASGAGGGLNLNGQNGNIGTGGASFTNGAVGGQCNYGSAASHGGFGGGGAGDYYTMGGAGGGYQGGSTKGGYTNTDGVYSAYGYNSGITQNNTSGITTSNTSLKSDGKVIITLLEGEALDFDGVNDQVNIGTGMNSVLDPLNKITVEAWVKPTNNTYLGVIVGNYGTTGGGMQFLLRRDFDEYAFWVDDGTGFKVVNSGVNTTTHNVWQHVAGVWDGSKLMIYINGVLKGTTTGVTGTSFASSANTVRMGHNSLATPEVFTGAIDEVRIWTTNRSQCEINTYKNCEIATSATGLLANYHFNQGMTGSANATVTTLTDASGNSYNGTLSNFNLNGTTSNWISPGGVSSGSVTPASLTPTVTASPSSTTVCSSQSALLTGGGASTYTWSGGITNAVAFTPGVSASYTVTGTNTSGCTNTAVSTVSVTSCSAAAGLHFDGTSDYVTAPHNTSLNFGTGDFTVESWFKSSVSQPNYAGVAVKQNSSGAGGFQLVIVNNRIAAEVSSSSFGLGTSGGLLGTTVLTDGIWHHLAMVVTRSQNKIELLVDGNVEATVINAGIATMDVNFTTPLLIGVDRTYTEEVNGYLDEVRLWNVARTKCQINTFKNCEIATTATGLVANYHFNQGFAAVNNPGVTTLTDASGNSITGTLTNFALSGSTSNWITPGGVITGSTTPASLTPAVTASATSSVICNGATTTLNGGGAATYVWTGGVTNGTSFSPTSTQSYTVTGTASTGCTNTAVQGVTVNSLPVVTASASNSVICNGQSTTLNGGGAST
ncbi:MAG: hypothetical protein K0S12_1308, partial [Bacteroidetes bacterium]|nr:hypothetical protein [Bacteroidota bacterium]